MRQERDRDQRRREEHMKGTGQDRNGWDGRERRGVTRQDGMGRDREWYSRARHHKVGQDRKSGAKISLQVHREAWINEFRNIRLGQKVN